MPTLLSGCLAEHVVVEKPATAQELRVSDPPHPWHMRREHCQNLGVESHEDVLIFGLRHTRSRQTVVSHMVMSSQDLWNLKNSPF